jgi:hypothetical protein
MKIAKIDCAQSLPDSVKQLLPATGTRLTLQALGFTHFDEDGGHFSICARNQHSKLTPLGFWTVYRKDGVGSGMEQNGRADMGWQL